MNRTLHGPLAALLTPRDGSGELALEEFESNIEFVLSQGVTGICINGATGEYVAATLDERRVLLEVGRSVVGNRGVLVCGIGAAGFADATMLGRHGLEHGADALLLPPPHFFDYREDDLEAFYREAARRIFGPILLYNLPSFAVNLETQLAIRLIESVPNVIGIKDSGGLSTLSSLTRNGRSSARRIVGNDADLAVALQGALCDGVISGVAGVLPELIVGIYRQHSDSLIQQLDELLRHIGCFPTPWGLKCLAQCRGLGNPFFLLPLSEARRRQITALAEWFQEWWQWSVKV